MIAKGSAPNPVLILETDNPFKIKIIKLNSATLESNRALNIMKKKVKRIAKMIGPKSKRIRKIKECKITE